MSNLSPVTSNVTQWLSTRNIVNYDVQLLSFLSDIVSAKMQHSQSINRIVQEIFKMQEYFDAPTKFSQDKSASLCGIRKYLDAAVQTFPNVNVKCPDSSKKSGHVEFEYAVAKIQNF